MNSDLSNALMELERTTDALLRTNVADLMAVGWALERRAEAIGKLASIAQREDLDGPARARIQTAFSRGIDAARELLALKIAAACQESTGRTLLRGLEGLREDAGHDLDYSA